MSFRSEVTADSPTNWWHLDEATGAATAAAAAGATTGTYNGSPVLGIASLDTSGAGSAMTLDGTNDEVTFGAPTFSPNPSANTGSFEMLFKWSAGTTLVRDNTSTGGWLLYDNGTFLGLRIAGSDKTPRIPLAAVRDGNWHHLVFTWNSTAGTCALYIDGVSIALGLSTVGATLTPPVMPWHVGKNGTLNAFSTGQVDEVAFYSTALSVSRVQAHYRALFSEPAAPSPTTYTDAVTPDSPTGWWRLDDPSDGRGVNCADAIGDNDAWLRSGLATATRVAGLLRSENGSAVSFANTADDQAVALPVAPGTTGSFECWFKWSSGVVIARDATGGSSGWIFGFDNAGTFGVRVNNADRNTTKTTAQVRDGNLHHLVVAWTSGSQTKIYLDGVDITPGGNGADTLSSGPLVPLYVGFNTGTTGHGSVITLDEIATYSTALSLARAQAHYAAGTVFVVAVGRATETDTAQPLGRLAARATEADVAQPVGRPGVVARATETDAAQPVGRVKTVAVARATEADAAQAVTRGSGFAQATETDTATAVGRLKTHSVGRATETDAARPVARLIAAAQATEMDVATAVTRINSIARAMETDSAQPVGRLKVHSVGRAIETDTAQVVVRVVFLSPDTWTNPPPVVYDPALTHGQPLSPDLLTNPAPTVRDPALVRGQSVSPDLLVNDGEFVIAPELARSDVLRPTLVTNTPVVPSPRLQAGQSLHPGLLTNAAPTVFSPRLRPGQLIEPDTPLVLTVTMFSPRIRVGTLLHPAFFTKPPATVFSPRMVQGQPIRPAFFTKPPATVFPPANLIQGQPLRPSFFTKPAATFYSPKLQHAQELEPDFFTAPPATIYDPRLALAQFIYPGPPPSGSPVVYDPALEHIVPSVVVIDPQAAGSLLVGIRPAK